MLSKVPSFTLNLIQCEKGKMQPYLTKLKQERVLGNYYFKDVFKLILLLIQNRLMHATLYVLRCNKWKMLEQFDSFNAQPSLTIWVCRWLYRRKLSFCWVLSSPRARHWRCWWSPCRKTSALWSVQKRSGTRSLYLYILLFYMRKWCLVSLDFKIHIKTAFHLNKHWQQTEAKKKGYCKSGNRKNKTILQEEMKKPTSSMTLSTLALYSKVMSELAEPVLQWLKQTPFWSIANLETKP